jgi:hypothetical protein
MTRKFFASLAILSIIISSCSNDDESAPINGNLTLNLNGLETLGNDYVYEGWIIVDGNPVSTGTFSSVTFPQTFSVNATQLDNATAFVLSIEPAEDPDPSPASTKIISGDFSGSAASVNSTSLVGDFSNSTGKYILATPTDTDDSNEASGVWFLDNSSGTATTGLNLPNLADGWKYEGWAVIDGQPVSTGTFSVTGTADDNASSSPYKGDANDGPPFPGEDFLKNAPAGLSFPTDLKGTTIVISVEPDPDNSPAPFTFKPLAHMVPQDAENHVVVSMGDGPLKEVTGTVSR